MDQIQSNGKAISKKELASLLTARDKSLVAEDSIARRIHLMQTRLGALRGFLNLNNVQFTQCRPSIERLLPLLAQSTVDISYSIIRRITTHEPRNTYDIFSSCERYGLLPLSLVEALGRQIVLIECDYNNMTNAEMLRLHRELPRIYRIFQRYMEEVNMLLHPLASEAKGVDSPGALDPEPEVRVKNPAA